jgi:hypothetical protein
MAVALFPLLDGETLSSNLGRYAESVGAESTLRLRRRVFGYPCKPDTRLPSGINHLAEQTRDYWGLTPEQILKRGTEFYYATVTMSAKQRESMFAASLGQPGSRAFRRSVGGWGVERVEKFRYCEECLAQWRESGTPAHWMVDHQLPGVYLCPVHSKMLKVAKRGSSANLTDSTILAMKDVNDEDVLPHASPSERTAFAEVAKLSAHCRTASGDVPSTARFRELLRTAGYALPTRGVDTGALAASMVKHFGHDYCQSTGLSLQRLVTWLNTIAAEVAAGESSHPFMFISVATMLNAHCAAVGTFAPAMRNKDATTSKVLAKKAHADPFQNGERFQCKGLLHRSDDAWQTDSGEKEGRVLVCSCGVTYQTVMTGRYGAIDKSVKIYGERYKNLVAMQFADNFFTGSTLQRFPSINPRLLRWARIVGFSKNKHLSRAAIQELRDRWETIVMNAPSGNRIRSSYAIDSLLYRTLYRIDRNWIRTFNQKWRTKSNGRSVIAEDVPAAQRGN